MSTLLVMKEQLQVLYAKYSTYITIGMRLILGLLVFGLINSNIGFMKAASSGLCTVGLAAVCAFLPTIVMVLAATALILLHLYSLSMVIAVRRRTFSDVYFLFPFYIKACLAGALDSGGICAESSVCRGRGDRTSRNTGLPDPGCVRCFYILYGSFCEDVIEYVQRRKCEQYGGRSDEFYKADACQ